MDDKNPISSFIALNDIDDRFVEEALTPKKSATPAVIAAVAAASAALIAAAAALVLLKKPDNVEALLPTDIPSVIETAEAPSGTPEPTAFVTAMPTGAETAFPSEGPSAEPSPVITPEITPDPTPAPTLTPAPEPTPTPEPSPTPDPTPTATMPPEPPVEPTEPPVGPTEPATEPPQPSVDPNPPQPTDPPSEFIYNSEADFAAAIRDHAHPALEGMTGYYVSAMHERLSLVQITGNSGSVTFRYLGQDGFIRTFGWYRNLGQAALDQIAASNPGSWYGGHYILDHGTSPYESMRVYWVEDGILFFAYIPGSTDYDSMDRFCDAVWKPV